MQVMTTGENTALDMKYIYITAAIIDSQINAKESK
jgi:hypothetical protein